MFHIYLSRNDFVAVNVSLSFLTSSDQCCSRHGSHNGAPSTPQPFTLTFCLSDQCCSSHGRNHGVSRPQLHDRCESCSESGEGEADQGWVGICCGLELCPPPHAGELLCTYALDCRLLPGSRITQGVQTVMTGVRVPGSGRE